MKKDHLRGLHCITSSIEERMRQEDEDAGIKDGPPDWDTNLLPSCMHRTVEWRGLFLSVWYLGVKSAYDNRYYRWTISTDKYGSFDGRGLLFKGTGEGAYCDAYIRCEEDARRILLARGENHETYKR